MTLNFLIGLFIVNAAEPTALNKFKNDVRCFIKKDASACESMSSRDGIRLSDRPYLEMGCLEAGSSKSCVWLGTWFQMRNQADMAERYYTKACDMKDPLGCGKLLEKELHRLDADPGQAQAIYDKWCGDSSQIIPQCKILAARIQESERSLSYKACELRYVIIHSENQTPTNDILKRSTPTTREDCSRYCASLFSNIVMSDDKDLRVLGQCWFDSSPFGGELERRTEAVERCSQTKMIIGFKETPFYQRCYCEGLEHKKLNAIAKPFGIFAAGETSEAKLLGTVHWYRCVAGFHFIDVAESQRDLKSCKQNLKSFMEKMSAETKADDWDYKYNDLKCTKL